MYRKGGNKRTYRRRNYRRRNGNSSRPWYLKKYNALDLAGKAYSGVKYLKGLVNSEMYDIINTATNSPILNTGSMVPLHQIAQGDGSDARTGNSILARSLFFRLVFKCNSSATVTTVRFMIVRDTQQVADTTPTAATILNSADPLSPLCLTVEGRFSVLKDKLITLNNVDSKSVPMKKFMNLYTHIRFNGAAGTDIQKNGLYALFISDEATNTPTISYNFKLSYHDN